MCGQLVDVVMIAAGHDDGAVAVFDASGSLRWEGHHGFKVTALCFSPDVATLAVGRVINDTASVELIEVESSERSVGVQCGSVKNLCFSPCGSLLVVGRKDGSVHALDKSGAEIWSFSREGGGSAKAVDFSPDGSAVAVGGVRRAVSLLDAEGSVIWNISSFEDTKVRTLRFSPGNDVLAVGDDNGRIALLSPETGVALKTVSCGFFIFSLQIHPTGSTISVLEGLYHEKKAFMLDVSTEAETAIVVGDGECDRLDGLQDCALSRDCAVLVVCTNADVGYVRAVDACTGRTLWKEERMNSVSCVAHGQLLKVFWVEAQHTALGGVAYVVTDVWGETVCSCELGPVSSLGDLRQLVLPTLGNSACMLLARSGGRYIELAGSDDVLIATLGIAPKS
uniref:Pyrrolo-quinoline quinone repeat domain-containing protein n=1 Tax=Noctiluca scintillans TaxID=2966 RepID=A0A7S1F0J3_NOCSC